MKGRAFKAQGVGGCEKEREQRRKAKPLEEGNPTDERSAGAFGFGLTAEPKEKKSNMLRRPPSFAVELIVNCCGGGGRTELLVEPQRLLQ